METKNRDGKGGRRKNGKGTTRISLMSFFQCNGNSFLFSGLSHLRLSVIRFTLVPFLPAAAASVCTTI